MKEKTKRFFKRVKLFLQPADISNIEKNSTLQLLRLTVALALETIVSFWRQHRLISRLLILLITAVLLFSIFKPIFEEPVRDATYDLVAYNSLLDAPIKQYADKLQFDAKKQEYLFNEGYTPGAGEASGDSMSAKVTASFATRAGDSSVTLNDPVNNVGITISPKFAVDEPKKDANRVIYPIVGKDALKVYTLKGIGVKEDIVLKSKPSNDGLKLEYEVTLPNGVELRSENDGSLAAYGVQASLLGNVSTGTEQDAELLKAARENGEKNKLLFRIPAPFIVEANNKQSSARAWFSLDGTKLTLFASGLSSASYPLSIDPTIYVETAAKFMRGNNETNVDFDTSNELIQKSQTTGARIDGWEDTTDMSAGLWDHSVATAGGYVYRAGGRIDPTMPYIAGTQSTQLATAGLSFSMSMPTTRPAGDLYIAIISRVGSGTITPPAGWLLYTTGTNATTTTRDVAMYYRVGVGSEPASYSWSNSASVQWTGVILRIKNFDSASPISATTAATTGTATTSSPPVFSTITPAHNATMIIRAVGINETDPTAYTWLPSGHTRLESSTSVADTASSTALVVATLDTPTLATVATGTTTMATDGIMTGNYGAVTIAIKPATVTAGYQKTVEWAQFNSTTYTLDSPNPGTGACTGWCSNSVYELPANRVGMSMIAYNGYLYALGGTPDGTAASGTTTVWIAKIGANGEPQLWHPSGGTPVYWYVSSQTLPAALSYTSIAAYKNKLYLVGGKDTSGNSLSAVRAADFLPTGDIGPWSTSGMFDLTTPSPRFGHSVHVYNDTMYVIGGSNSGTLLNTVYYSKINSDGSMNAWVQTTSFTTARSSFGGQMTGVWGGYIYLAGGCSALTTGYCSTIQSDVQLASINADGTLAPWNSILTLSNQRVGYSFAAWQGGLYRFGGCNRQNTTTGVCYATQQGVEFGAVNPAGDASTVSNSDPYSLGAVGGNPCSGYAAGSPNLYNCDLPDPGDGAGQGGQMASMVVINNGYIYNIGGCTDVTTANECSAGAGMSGNTAYAALNSSGQMIAPSICPGTSSGLWCVDNTNQINGTNGVGAAAATVFNNTIYVIGGTTGGGTWTSNVYYVLLNADGSLSGSWTTLATGTTGLPGTFVGVRTDNGASTNLGSAGIGYGFAFTRANPASAGSTPGNLYYLGGCVGTGGVGCAGYAAPTPAYTNEVYKCNIGTSGSVSGCTKTGQMQIDADNLSTGNQGIGLMAGTVYANRIYLVGGACGNPTGSGASDPCGSSYAANRRDTIYAKIDGSNNIVDNSTGSSGGSWSFTTGRMDPVRRRGVSFGYNGYIYSLAGYSGTVSLQDLLFAKIDVSTGDMEAFDSSGVVVTPRWDLRAIVSNGYVYAIGGCGTGAAPNGCTALQPEVQTFQLYNNDSGTPVSYAASANQFTTDRMGASSTILNGYLYVAGGCTTTAETCTATIDSVQYSPIDVNGGLGPWVAGGNLPSARAWGQLENAGGTLYYVGGQSNTATDERPEVYWATPSAGAVTWATVSSSFDLPDGRTQHSAAVWDDRIYVTGGIAETGGAASAVVYVSPDLSSGGTIGSAWTTSTSFNVARSGHTTIAYANNLYVIGGYDGTSYLSDVQFTSIGYKTGTIQQSGTSTVTGSGTAWTSAMVGSILQYRDGEIATILTVPSGTSMTVSVSKTVAASTGYTIQDGSIGSWSYTTSLPEPIRQADGYAANGYMYLVGGRSSSGDCVPNTLQAPISANTTISSGNDGTGVGEWYETNVKYTGDRYGNAVSYANGKLYTLGGACESFPTVSSITTKTFTSDAATSHAVTMPATVDVGDLLVVLLTTDGGTGSTVTTPAGWTLVGTQTRTTNVRGSVFAKDAAGTEDGANVDFVTSAGEQAASQVYRIPAAKWEGNIASVEAASVDPGGNTASPDPPSLNPAGWGTENTLWLTYAAGSAYASVTTYPATHTNGLHNISNSGTAGASASSTQFTSNAASVDPGAYTMAASTAGVAFTVAIRPATFAYTNANRAVQTTLYSQPQVAAYSRLIDTDTDVFPTSWLMNGLDNSIGARWQAKYRSMHDINPTTAGSDSVLTTPPATYTLQQNPNEDCGTSATMTAMTTWGRETNYGNVALGDVASYTARNGVTYSTGTITQSGTTVTGVGTTWTTDDLKGGVLTYYDGTTATIVSVDSTTQLTVNTSKTISPAQTYSAGGGNINCARYYYFYVSIDASQTFGYPEDVNRGPTISDLSLFFTSDPSKRLRHGKTFTGGEQQPLDTPCRQSIDAQCPLP